MAQQEVRKVVTVVFCDVVGSTALGESLDPEAVRQVMSRYFDAMNGVLQRHGGTVEKFIGDAVMAVFGVPDAHEDDALRAVRAAVEMREEVVRLNHEFSRTWGATLQTRTGVNTGTVIASDPGVGGTFVVGDAVNVAARLEQAAAPGEIIIGDFTYRLIRGAVTAQELPPLAVKGKTDALHVWRVIDVAAHTPGVTRRMDSSLVSRREELRALSAALDRVVSQRRCELVTVVGPAGVGKSRLVVEFLSRVDSDVARLEGNCLAYGQGITFWPILKVLRDAADLRDSSTADAQAKLEAFLPSGEVWRLVRDRLAPLLGLADKSVAMHETFWALRKVFEHLASQRPLVFVLDDLHWAEPTLLDLLQYLVDSLADAPVLLLCMARGELLESAPGWAAEQAHTRLLRLRPLDNGEVHELIAELTNGAAIDSSAVDRIAEMAEGNPLFVEETLRMLIDDGFLQRDGGRWYTVGDLAQATMPPTIHAILGARLDRLSSEECTVIERASVVGRVFWWGAVEGLTPADLRARVGARLHSLVRKELIKPERSELADEDAFRFVHTLLRDTAYEGLPKVLRADLHQGVAHWIEDKVGDRTAPYDELIGYHLEQAHRCLREFAPPSQRTRALAAQMVAVLGRAGQRAYARGDMPAAVKLLTRATAPLDADDPERLRLLPSLAFSLLETGDFNHLQPLLEEAETLAEAADDPGLQGHLLILRLWTRLLSDPQGWVAQAEDASARAVDLFDRLGDELGLSRGWALRGLVHVMKAHFSEAEEACRKAVAHARAAGDLRGEMEHRCWVLLTMWAAPTPASDGLRRCAEFLEQGKDDKKVMATALFIRGGFEAMLGRFGDARQSIAEARSRIEEVALAVWAAGPLTQMVGWVELLAEDFEAAERELRWGAQTLQAMGEYSWLSTTSSLLAEALYGQGRYDEAEKYTQLSQEAAAAEDVYSQVLWRAVRAKTLARQDKPDEALALARQAAALVADADFPFLHAHVLLGSAELLADAGHLAQARTRVEQAVRLSREKENQVLALRAEELLTRLRSAPLAPLPGAAPSTPRRQTD